MLYLDNRVFKAICDVDTAPIVICDTQHTIVYMNNAACRSYSKYGGPLLVGKSILDCHNEHSCEMIKKVVEKFKSDIYCNIIYTYHNEKQNKDVFMVALRNDFGELIGYYEKHNYLDKCTMTLYDGIEI